MARMTTTPTESASRTVTPTPTPAPAASVTSTTPAQRRAIATEAFGHAIGLRSPFTPDLGAAFIACEKPGSVLAETFGRYMAAMQADPEAFTDPEKVAAMQHAATLRAAIEAAIVAARPKATPKASTPDPAAMAAARTTKAAAIMQRAAIAAVEAFAAATKALAAIEGLTPDEEAAARDRVAAMTPEALLVRPARTTTPGAGKATLDPAAITPGTVLEHGAHRCTYNGPEAWQVGTVTYASATAAAKAVNGGTSVNGLAFWKVPTAG